MSTRAELETLLAGLEAFKTTLRPAQAKALSSLLEPLRLRLAQPERRGSFWQDPAQAAQAKARMSAAQRVRWGSVPPTHLEVRWRGRGNEVLTLDAAAALLRLTPKALINKLSTAALVTDIIDETVVEVHRLASAAKTRPRLADHVKLRLTWQGGEVLEVEGYVAACAHLAGLRPQTLQNYLSRGRGQHVVQLGERSVLVLRLDRSYAPPQPAELDPLHPDYHDNQPNPRGY